MEEEMESMIDARSSQRAITKRFQNIPQDLRTRIDDRNNDAIIQYIETESSNINENFKVNTHLCMPGVFEHFHISSVLFFS